MCMLKCFFPAKHLEHLPNPKEQAIHQLRTWNFPPKDQKIVSLLLDEWHSGRTLNSVLQQWERVSVVSSKNQIETLKILCYNVQGWYTRALEAIELVYKEQASICVFTEVGQLWNKLGVGHLLYF